MAITHALVAGAIATKVANPALAASLSLGSHFVLDSIPHWDFGTEWKKRSKFTTGVYAITDTVTSFFIAYLVFGNQVTVPVLLLCVAASLLPDWLEAPLYIFFAHATYDKPLKHASWIERFFYRVYKTTNLFHTKTTFFWGVLTQIISVSLVLLVLQ